MIYLACYKPYGVLSQFGDAEGRPTLQDFIPIPGLVEVGRLDYDSEGLILLTDDGMLAHRLTHPRYHVPKIYLVQVEGLPGPEAQEALRRGVLVKGLPTAPAEVEVLSAEPTLPARAVPIAEKRGVTTSWLRLTLHEGRKRQVRHMTAAIGHPTLRLVRVAIGPLQVGDLQPGQWRSLLDGELAALRRSLGRQAQTHV